MIRYPKPLRPGDTIAITAPSSGITTNGHAQLDMAIHHLRELGYQVVEGNCLRKNLKGARASAEERATELMRFLTDSLHEIRGGSLSVE